VSRGKGGGAFRDLRGYLILAALAAPGAVRAQDPTTPDSLRERTGPSASFPTAEPAPLPPAPLTPPTSEPGATTQRGEVTFSEIRVVDPDRLSAPPLSGWRPAPDPATGLALDHAPGEALDAGWVARQFTGHAMIGRPVGLDRVTALVQQINRAFIANGYINSGVLLGGPPPMDGAPLELILVAGRLVPPSPDATAVEVVWGPHGARGLSRDYILHRMPAAGDVPLNALALEREFRLLADDPAIRTVNVGLRPGAEPGEALLTLAIDPQPRVDVYLSAANNRSPSIGGERIAAGGWLRSILTPGDLISGEAGLTADRGDVALGYEAPLFGPKTWLLLRGGYNEAAVVDRPLLPLDISSTDLNFEGGLTRRLYERALTPRR